MTTFGYHVIGETQDGQLDRQRTAQKVVADYLAISPEDVYVVWFAKTLQNWKALLSTDKVNTGVYFEVTFDGDKQRLYFDHYQKVTNRAYMVTMDVSL